MGIHKVLGISCLCSFVYRLSQFGQATDCEFRRPKEEGGVVGSGVLFFVLFHLMLSCSSFRFRIPQKRITIGYRIWPEARIHALVFFLGSFALMLKVLWIPQNEEQDRYDNNQDHVSNILLNTLVVLASGAAADWGSRSVGISNRSNTIRDLQAPAGAKYFFSLLQFHGTAACLLTMDRYTTQFLFVLVI